MNGIPGADVRANSNSHLAVALEMASRHNAMAGMGDKMTSVHLERLQDTVNVAFSNKSQGINVMVGLIRGSGLLESDTAVAKATVTDMLQTSPDVLAGVISNHQTSQAMATALNNLSKTVIDAEEPPSRVYSVIGDLSPRIADGQPRQLFWQQMFTAADSVPNSFLRDEAGNLEIQGLTQLFQRMAPELREGLVEHLDANHPLDPADLPAAGGPSWGMELHDRMSNLGIIADVRSLKPTAALDSTTQLLMAAENPNLPADALLQPMLHIAQDPAISQAVLPTLLSSANGALVLSRLAASSPELASHLAERLEQGEITGPAAKMLRSMAGVKTQVTERMDALVQGGLAGVVGPSGPLDVEGTITSETDLSRRMDKAGITDPVVRADVTTRWVGVVNASSHSALIMAENSPELITHLTPGHLNLFVEAHFADIERFASKVATNPHFRAEASAALQAPDATPEAYRSRVLMRAVTDLGTARDVIKGAVKPDGSNIKEVIERTIEDPQFLGGPDRAGAIKTLVEDLIALPAPAGQAAVDRLALVVGGISGASQDLKVVVGKVLIDAGRGDELSGISLLSTMKSNGFVPPVISIRMAEHMVGLSALTDFARHFPDLGDQLRDRWPVGAGAPPVPPELTLDRLGPDRVAPDQGLQKMVAAGRADQHAVDMMVYGLKGNPAAIGSTLAEVEKQVSEVVNKVPKPSMDEILASPVFKVLSTRTDTGASVWDRLAGVAGDLGRTGSSSELGDRAVAFVTKTRVNLVAQFVGSRSEGLAERAETMTSIWALCPGEATPGSEKYRMVSSLLETAGKTKNVTQAAQQLMMALQPLVGDPTGGQMVTETLKGFMGKSDMQAAAVFAGLSGHPELASAALDALNSLHSDGPRVGTALQREVSRFVCIEIGFPDKIAQGKLGRKADTTDKLMALADQILTTRMKQDPDIFSKDMARYMADGLAYPAPLAAKSATALFGKVVRSTPQMTEMRNGKSAQPWVSDTLSALTELDAGSLWGTLGGLGPTSPAVRAALVQLEEFGLAVPTNQGRVASGKRDHKYTLTGDGLAALSKDPLEGNIKRVVDGLITAFPGKTEDQVKAALLKGSATYDALIASIVPAPLDQKASDADKKAFQTAKDGAKTALRGLLLHDPTASVTVGESMRHTLDPLFGADSTDAAKAAVRSANRERLAASVTKAMPDEAAEMTRLWDDQPMFKWCPDLKTGFRGDRWTQAGTVMVGITNQILSGGTPSANHGTGWAIGAILGTIVGAGQAAVRATRNAMGAPEVPKSLNPMNLDTGTAELMAMVESDGITEVTLDFAAVPKDMHGAAAQFEVPIKVIESSVKAEAAADTPKKRAALGMLIATGLAEGGTDARTLVATPAHSDVMDKMGLSLDRLDRAEVRMRQLVDSDTSTSLDGARILKALSKEGFSLTEILVTSRSLEVRHPGTNWAQIELHQALFSVGPEELVAAALVGADVRARAPGADVGRIKQQLMTDMMMMGTQVSNHRAHPDFDNLTRVLNDPATAGPSDVKTKVDSLGLAIAPDMAAPIIANGMSIADILAGLGQAGKSSGHSSAPATTFVAPPRMAAAGPTVLPSVRSVVPPPPIPRAMPNYNAGQVEFTFPDGANGRNIAELAKTDVPTVLDWHIS